MTPNPSSAGTFNVDRTREPRFGVGGSSYVILARGMGPDSGPINELRDEYIDVESSLERIATLIIDYCTVTTSDQACSVHCPSDLVAQGQFAVFCCLSSFVEFAFDTSKTTPRKMTGAFTHEKTILFLYFVIKRDMNSNF